MIDSNPDIINIVNRIEGLLRAGGNSLDRRSLFNRFLELVNKKMFELNEVKNAQGINYDSLYEEVASGEDYELYCANVLEQCGWGIQRTSATGDQGVDIIAISDGVRVVIQCKFYSKPVGNAAVQEVVAGKIFYDGDYAVVVSNNSFTSSARSLAQSGGVVLVHHEQLCNLKDMLGCFEEQDSIEHAID